jgi:hypothetical protein
MQVGATLTTSLGNRITQSQSLRFRLSRLWHKLQSEYSAIVQGHTNTDGGTDHFAIVELHARGRVNIVKSSLEW